MERIVIFDLRFWMEVRDEEPVVKRDDVIEQHVQWDGVARAVA